MSAVPWETALDRLIGVALPDLDGDPRDLPIEVFDAVEGLIEALGRDDIAEIVAEAVDAGRISLKQATLFVDIAAWSGTDNGASMQRTLDTWVRQANDTVRLAIALHHEAYPLPTAAEMTAKLTEIASSFPEFRQICERRIASR